MPGIASQIPRTLWTQSRSWPFQAKTFPFRLLKIRAVWDFRAHPIQIFIFKDKETEAQGHIVREWQRMDLSLALRTLVQDSSL